ncbi:MAG: glycosyltransferase family 39 protein [Planctomycetota bacterium]|nr:glycosyltransferase family 39 protein [Planctomycetota bacterium]
MSQAARFWKILSIILICAFSLYLLGNQRVPLWDRDEPRYAECSREMLLSGDWIVPRFLGDFRLEKPPLIYWCQAAVMSVIGDTAQAARLPSSIAIVLSALVLGLMVRRFAGSHRALWSVLIFCTSGLVIAAAKMCITDAVLLLCVLVGQACLGIMYAAHQRGKKAPIWVAGIFWISTGFAGLTKGPQAAGFHFFTLVILLLLDVGASVGWKRAIAWWQQLQPIFGIPILAIVAAPWMIAIHYRAPGFLDELFHKARMHAGGSMEGHGEPPGYHLLLIFGTFFPWSLLLPTAISLAWQNRRLPAVRFAMAATAGPWLLMEMVTTKLPFYVLPAFPGLAFLTADALIRCGRGQFIDLRKKIFMVAVAVWAVAAVGLSFGLWVTAKISAHPPIAGLMAFSVCGVMYAAVVAFRFSQGRIMRAAAAMGVGMVIMIAILFMAILPNLDFLQLSERLVARLQPLGACGNNVRVAMIDYKEPSLAFYQGGGAREQDDGYLRAVPSSQWPRWIIVTKTIWGDPLQINPRMASQLRVVAAEHGIAYADKGREETVLILEKRPTVSQLAGP